MPTVASRWSDKLHDFYSKVKSVNRKYVMWGTGATFVGFGIYWSMASEHHKEMMRNRVRRMLSIKSASDSDGGN